MGSEGQKGTAADKPTASGAGSGTGAGSATMISPTKAEGQGSGPRAARQTINWDGPATEREGVVVKEGEEGLTLRQWAAKQVNSPNARRGTGAAAARMIRCADATLDWAIGKRAGAEGGKGKAEAPHPPTPSPSRDGAREEGEKMRGKVKAKAPAGADTTSRVPTGKAEATAPPAPANAGPTKAAQKDTPAPSPVLVAPEVTAMVPSPPEAQGQGGTVPWVDFGELQLTDRERDALGAGVFLGRLQRSVPK